MSVRLLQQRRRAARLERRPVAAETGARTCVPLPPDLVFHFLS